jgi:dihydrofolate reductase
MTAIFVADNNWAIGVNGKLLARLPEDMKNFKDITTGNVVVMGRKTYESFPKRPLPDRENCVISRSMDKIEGARVFGSIESFLEYEKTLVGEVYVIGGGEIYSQLLPCCKKAIVTRVYECFGGDTFVPDMDRLPEWELKETSPVLETGCHKIRFMLYEKR